MITVTSNPFEEKAMEEDQLREQLHHISCPHCKNTMNHQDFDIEDYYTKAPPEQTIFKVHWTCQNCCQSFTTEHNLILVGREYVIEPVSVAVEVEK